MRVALPSYMRKRQYKSPETRSPLRIQGAHRFHASIRLSFFAPHLNCLLSSTSCPDMRETSEEEGWGGGRVEGRRGATTS